MAKAEVQKTLTLTLTLDTKETGTLQHALSVAYDYCKPERETAIEALRFTIAEAVSE